MAFGVVGANSILMRCTYFNLTGIEIIRVFRIDAIEVFINIPTVNQCRDEGVLI